VLARLLVTPAASAAPETAALVSLSRTNLLEYRGPDGRGVPVQTITDWEKRRAEIVAAFQSVAGPLPRPERHEALDVTVEDETDCGDYIRRSITYSSEPGSKTPAYLLIPRAALEGRVRAHAVLCLHQTHPLGRKVVAGLGNSPDDEYGVELARRGYVCLAPSYPLLADYHPDLKALGYRSGTMKAVGDNRRGLDLLESLPFVKPGAFGVIGHSLGGHNAIFTALFDDRLKAIAVSCSFDSFSDYMNGDIRGWTSERYMPRLLEYRGRLAELPFDFHELIAALAPRPVFINAPMGDTNFKWKSVAVVATAARPVFALYGVPDHLEVEHPDCGHRFPPALRQKAYEVFDATLR